MKKMNTRVEKERIVMAFYYLWPRLLKELKFSFYTWGQLRDDKFVKVEEGAHFRAKYHFKDYRDNLLDPPNEIHSKELEVERYQKDLSCIDSRRALLFNLYGNRITFIVPNPYRVPDGKYQISYKRRVQVIKGKNLTTTLDAVLYCERKNSLIISRVRMFEWLVLKNDLIKDSYFIPEKYINKKAGRVFAAVIQDLLTDCRYDCEDSVGKFANLDGLHIIKEIIAAYNLLSTTKEYENVDKLTITEIYWKPTHFENLGQAAGRVFVKEQLMLEELEEFKRIIKPVRFLFLKDFGVELEVKCIDLWEMVMMQIKDQRQTDWYYRYTI